AAGGLRTLALPEGDTTVVRFSTRGDFVALVRYEGRHKTTMYIADVRTGAVRALGDASRPLAADAAVTPTRQPVDEAEAGFRRFVLHGGDCAKSLRNLDLNGCSYAPDGTRAAFGVVDKTVRIVDTATDAMRIVGSHDGTALTTAFSPDGETLASGG